MARLFIGNDAKALDSILERNVGLGFKKFISFNDHEISVMAFNKLKVDNENFYQDGNDYVAGIGSYIYKDSIGEPALSKIYDDFSGDIVSLRRNIIGNYLIAIKKNGRICIFCDQNNIFNAYYYIKDKMYIVSNCLYEIVHSPMCMRGGVTVNEYNFIEQIFQYNILGNETVFNEIQKLLGNEYLEINVEKNSIQKKCLYANSPYKIIEKPIEELVDNVCTNLLYVTKKIKDCFNDDICQCMTGGLDARMIMAAYLANESKVHLTYGVGNSQLTNTKSGDLEVDKIYSEKYNLPLKIMDWSTPDRVDEFWDKYIDKYGFYASLYSSSDKVMTSFESVEERVLNLGAYGELYRNVDWINSIESDYITLDSLLDNFYIEKQLDSVIPDWTEYKNHLKRKIKYMLKQYGISFDNNDRISKNYYTFLEFERRKNADSSPINLINQHRYSFAILAEPSLIENVFLPIGLKKNARFIIKILNKLYPSILEVPFFSRCQWRVYDPNTMLIVEKKSSTAKYIKQIKKILFKNRLGQILYYRLGIVYQSLKGNNKTSNESKKKALLASQLSDIISKYSIFSHKVDPLTSEYLSKESRYAILLRTIHTLGLGN